MSKYTGDLVEIGIGKEAIRGTPIAPTFGYRWSDVQIDEKAITALDESRLGIIEDSRNLNIVGTTCDGSIKMPMRDKTVGLILLSLFGTDTPAVVGGETLVYDHVLTVAQNVNHPSLTICRKDPNASYDHALAMIGKAEIEISSDKHVLLSFDFKSKGQQEQLLGAVTITIATPGVLTLTNHGLVTGDQITLATTDTLPTGLVAGTVYFVVKLTADTFSLATTLANALVPTKIATSVSQAGTHTVSLVCRNVTYATENVFLPQYTTLKLATTQAGLDAASAINIRKVKLTIEQNIEEDRSLGSLAPTDIVNRNFAISAEIDIVSADNTYVTALLANTIYALRLDITNSDVVIGNTSNPRVRIDLHQVILESAVPDIGKGNLVIQKLKFKATYKETDSKMVTATVRNLVAAY